MGDEDDDDDGGGGTATVPDEGVKNKKDGVETPVNVTLIDDDKDEYIQQINTINIKFPYNRWLKREEIKELIYNKTGPGSISSIYYKVSFWRVKFKNKDYFEKVLNEGIEYKYQEKKFLAKPEEVFSNAIEVTISKVPEEIPDKKLKNIMINFGEVKNMVRQTDEDGVENGVRKCKMVLETGNEIPPVIKLPDHFTGEEIDIFYVARPRNFKNFSNWCYICHAIDHEVELCPRRKKCRICDGKGKPHLERHCLERRRSRKQKSNTPGPTPGQTEEECGEDAARKAASKTVDEIRAELEKQQQQSSQQSTQQEAHIPISKVNKELPKQSSVTFEKDEENKRNQQKQVKTGLGVDETMHHQEKEDSGIPANVQAGVLKVSTSALIHHPQATQSVQDDEILFIGDSQVSRMRKKVTNKNVIVKDFSGGGFHRITYEMGWQQRCFSQIVIYAGTNETFRTDKQIKKGIKDMIIKAKDCAKDVYVCGIVPIYGRSKGQFGCDEMNKKLKEEALEHRVGFIPKPECFHENRSIDSYYQDDMIHLSDSGAAKVIDNINLFVKLKEPELKRVHDKSPAVPHKHKKKESLAVPASQ